MKKKIVPTLLVVFFASIFTLQLYFLITNQANQAASKDLITLAGDLAWGLIPIEFTLLAALILSQQPGNLIGWLLILPAIGLGGDVLDIFFVNITAAPAAPTAAFILALWFRNWSWLLLIFPILFILLLFPTGKLFSPRWRWAAIFVLGVCAAYFMLITVGANLSLEGADWSVPNPIGFIPGDFYESYLIVPLYFGLLLATLLSVISMVVRFRHSPIVEREQIKWMLYSCCLFAAIFITTILFNVFGSASWEQLPALVNVLLPIGIMCMPAAIGIAILRYRLWDIDVLIRRTLVYSILTAILALVYLGVVTLLQSLLSTISDQQSAISIVISTLAIAALFNPLRKRIQEFIDRRFYRRKYVAEQALAGFSTAAREETNVESLSGELIRITQETLQPEQVSFWIRPIRKST